MSIVSTWRPYARAVTTMARKKLAEKKVHASLSATWPAAAPECVIYFAGEPINAYQVRQWYAPMLRLHRRHPVAVVVTNSLSARELARDSPVPVILASTSGQLDAVVTDTAVRVVFYVNNNKENFSALRYTTPVHIHLSHGESDKVSMASNQLKAYDAVFIAGEASKKRITAHVRGMDPKRLVPIGRPQLDVDRPPPPLVDDGRTVVLYAPTWEGDRPAMAYGSVLSHGTAMVDALLADPSVRLIYRPHPRVGIRDARAAAASGGIRNAIDAANVADPAAGHVVDESASFDWQLDAADVCICDISAVAADWLATRKPMIVTEPADPRAAIDRDGMAGALPLVPAADASQVARTAVTAAREGTAAEQLRLVDSYFGDTAPGAATERFLAAVEHQLSTH